MDHVVYLDTKSLELENILKGKKTMIIRGATGRKIPYGRVEKKDVLYFIENNGSGKIKAKAEVNFVFCSEKLSKEDSIKLVKENQEKLLLTDKQFIRWGGKRYIVLIGIGNIKEIKEFLIAKNDFGNMDDWLLVGDIQKVKKEVA